MKAKTIVQVLLGLAIVGLAFWLYTSIMKPVRFDHEYNARREACATKLKGIRTLQEQYKLTYGVYCGDFDTLINRLYNEDSLKITQRVFNYSAIPADVDINEVPQLEAIKKGYLTLIETYVNPIAQLREQGKLKYKDADGFEHEFTDEDIRNFRYVPYPTDKKYEFQLDAGKIERAGLQVPVFEAKVDLKDLLSDLPEQEVINKIASIERIPGKYAGWKVGDMNQSITDGNFE